MPFRYSLLLAVLVVFALSVLRFEQIVQPRISVTAEILLWAGFGCVFGLIPLSFRIFRFIRLRRELDLKMKRVGGFCPVCGYNLRGIISLQCPECGATRNSEDDLG